MGNDEAIRLTLFVLILVNLGLNIVNLSVQLDRNSKISELENETVYLKTKISDLENKTKLVYIDNTERTYDRGHGNERNLMVPTGNQEFVWINEDSSTVKGYVTEIQDCPNSMPTTKILTPNQLTNMKIYGCDALINGKWVQNLTWAECERLRGR